MEKIIEILVAKEFDETAIRFEIGLYEDKLTCITTWGNALILLMQRSDPAALELLEIMFGITETIKDDFPDVASAIRRMKHEQKRGR